MNDAIITDNERINIEPKDVMVKGSNKKQGVNAQTSTQRRPEHQGMAKVIINPGTPDFNRFLTARNGAVIRGFDDVSIAISLSLKRLMQLNILTLFRLFRIGSTSCMKKTIR